MSRTDPTATWLAQNPAAVDDPKAVCAHSIHIMADGDLGEFEALIHPEATNREAAREPMASRGRGLFRRCSYRSAVSGVVCSCRAGAPEDWRGRLRTWRARPLGPGSACQLPERPGASRDRCAPSPMALASVSHCPNMSSRSCRHRGEPVGIEDQASGEFLSLADAPVGDMPRQVDMLGQPGVHDTDRCENPPGPAQHDQAVLKLEDYRPRRSRQVDETAEHRHAGLRPAIQVRGEVSIARCRPASLAHVASHGRLAAKPWPHRAAQTASHQHRTAGACAPDPASVINRASYRGSWKQVRVCWAASRQRSPST